MKDVQFFAGILKAECDYVDLSKPSQLYKESEAVYSNEVMEQCTAACLWSYYFLPQSW